MLRMGAELRQGNLILVLPVEIVFFHRILRKAFHVPMHGRLRAARFIWLEIPAVAWVPPSLVQPRKKPNPSFSKAKIKASGQSACLTLRLSPLEPTWSAEDPRWPRASWQHVFLGSKITSLFPWGYIISGLVKDQALFQNNQSTSQAFPGLYWTHLILTSTALVFTSPFIFLCLPTVICREGSSGSLGMVWSSDFLVKEAGSCSPVDYAL